MNSEKPTAAKASREPKHYDLMFSLEEVRSTRRHVRRLLDSIVGADSKVEEVEPPIAPETLLFVLDNVSGMIKEECNSIRGITDDIRSAIL